MGPTGFSALHISSSGTYQFPFLDPRGNQVASVQASGTVAGTVPAPDAVGLITTGSGTTAGVLDFAHTYPTEEFGSGPSALALGHREYDDTTGRFLSRDPLGYGGGFYDRTLSRLRKMKKVLAVGLAYDEQKVDAVPAESYDEKLDWVLTPSGPQKCR